MPGTAPEAFIHLLLSSLVAGSSPNLDSELSRVSLCLVELQSATRWRRGETQVELESAERTRNPLCIC